jgi:hypothetical protein
MQYFPYDPWRKYASPLFDPLSVTGAALASLGGGSAATGGAMALTGIGAGLSAANTLAGGSYAAQAGQLQQQAANFQAQQLQENAPGEIAAAQRQAIDVNQKANVLRSSAVANAAAGGVNAGTGSALTNQAQIVNKGQQNSLLDLWQGQNRDTGLLNQAQGVQFSGAIDALAGQQAQQAANLNAMSTIAGGGASLLRMYGQQR